MILEALPSSLTLILTEAALLIVGIVAEKHYVSRLSIFTNSVALTVHYLSQDGIGFWTGIYADLAIILGIVGLVAYILERSLSTYYYDIVYFLFSSVNVGLVIGLSAYSFFIPLFLGIGFQVVLLMIYDAERLIYLGKYPGSVKKFHEENNLVLEDGYNRQVFDFSDWF